MSLRRSNTFGASLGCLVLVTGVATTGCVAEAEPEDEAATVEQSATGQNTATFPAHFARQWMTNLANSAKGDGISPPVAARAYSYGAIAVYESVVHGMPGYRSLAGQLNGLDNLPRPAAGKVYDWPTVLAHTMHIVSNGAAHVYPTRLFFQYTTLTQASLTSLGPTQIGFRRAAGVSERVIADSMTYAEALGGALVGWMKADGYDQVRFKGWVEPTGEDKWVPTGFSDLDKVANPTEPHFGTLRPLVLRTPDECAPPAPPRYSADPTSEFYIGAKEVHTVSQNMTWERANIARFWADGPVDTTTPAGHWLALVTKQVRPGNLADAAAAYAFTSLAYYDAFIACWESKFDFNLLRPETYIRRNIDPGWRSFLPTPQFPSYVSGHSSISAAAAVTLTKQFGNGTVVDDTKTRRGFAPRTFANYTAAAEEASVSRLYGGIHYRFDNERGLDVGRCVGEKVVRRVRMK